MLPLLSNDSYLVRNFYYDAIYDLIPLISDNDSILFLDI